MYKYEVLAPAGQTEAIIPLIEAGADAIYVGLEGFSSRPKSSDLTLKEIAEAVEICHSRNVHLHVAVNGCVPESCINDIYDELKMLDSMGVDAIIIADWGVLSNAVNIVKRSKLHASTLLGTYNAHTIKYLKQMGITRVVLSTNLFLDEMAAIIDSVPDIEYEIVASGGICFNDNRICELPHMHEGEDYTVYCKQSYDLQVDGITKPANRISSKEISVAETADLYLELGITSFKIEGRTIDYHYVIPKVEKMKNYLEKASQRDNTRCSSLHYVAERRRLGL